MQGFVAGEVDILVSTMIVESGLDVPNANTMVVHDAHRFGLAQLYQLRGRVGRSHRRAYCYLLVPDTIDADAEERLKVLEHHTDLGAGYRIALKDLELRGAGNLLGAEQSGHAQAVGFDLYLRWLEETVRSAPGPGTTEQPPPPDVVLDRPAHLPDGYVPDDDVKLDLYRRLARASSSGDIDGLRDELRERFGPLPVEAETLLDMARLRVLGAVLGLQHVLVRGDEARLTFRAGRSPRIAGLTAALDDVQLAAEVRRTVPLSLRLLRLGASHRARAGAGAARRWARPSAGRCRRVRAPDVDPYLESSCVVPCCSLCSSAPSLSPPAPASGICSPLMRTRRPRRPGWSSPRTPRWRSCCGAPRASGSPADGRVPRQRLGRLRALRRGGLRREAPADSASAAQALWPEVAELRGTTGTTP